MERVIAELGLRVSTLEIAGDTVRPDHLPRQSSRPKQKRRKPNISDEERQRRRDHMLAIRAKQKVAGPGNGAG